MRALGPLSGGLIANVPRDFERHDKTADNSAFDYTLRSRNIEPRREVVVDLIGEGLAAIDGGPIDILHLHDRRRCRKSHGHDDTYRLPRHRKRTAHGDLGLYQRNFARQLSSRDSRVTHASYPQGSVSHNPLLAPDARAE